VEHHPGEERKMYLRKEKFEELKEKYKNLLIVQSDVTNAMNFVYELLKAEADAIKVLEPYATSFINRTDEAAYAVFDLCGDIENEIFSEGQVCIKN
jgi:uncharacterized Fe-S cluster-containing protein